MTKTIEESHSEIRTHEFPARVPAHSRVRVDAWIYSGSFDLIFTGMLELRTTSGAKARIPISGVQASYSSTTAEEVKAGRSQPRAASA